MTICIAHFAVYLFKHIIPSAYLSLRLVKGGLKARFLSVRGDRSLPKALRRLALPLFNLPPQPPEFCIKHVPRHTTQFSKTRSRAGLVPMLAL